MYSFLAAIMLQVAVVSWMHVRAYKKNSALTIKSHQLDQLPALCKRHAISFTSFKDIPLGNFLITMEKRNYYIVEETPKKRTLKDRLDDDFCKKHADTAYLISTLSHQNQWYAIIYKHKKSSNVSMAIANVKNRLIAYKSHFADSFDLSSSSCPFTDLHFVGTKILLCIHANRLYQFMINEDTISYQKIRDKDLNTGAIVDLDVVSIAVDPKLPIAFILKNKKVPLKYDICAVNLITKKYKKIDEFKSGIKIEHYAPCRIGYKNDLLTIHSKNIILPINRQVFTIPTAIYKI